jgi:predicted Zn-dependent protease
MTPTRIAQRLLLAVLLFFSLNTFAADDAPMRAMKDELARSMAQIQLLKMDRPYFLAYRMDDLNQLDISAMLGSLTQHQPTRMRFIGVEVRVGDYALDNSNYFSARSFAGGMQGMLSSIRQASTDDDYQQLRRSFWLATDAEYKRALEDLSAKRAALAAQNHTGGVPDFTKAPVNTQLQPLVAIAVPQQDLEVLARDLSAVFRTMPGVYGSSVAIQYRDHFTRYINSDGSVFTRSQPMLKIQINAQTQAPDGTPVSDSLEFYGHTLADLPAKADLLARTRAMGDRILKLRAAPSEDHYNGPVLFEGEAAPEILMQQFADGLVATRTPVSDDARFEMFFNQLMSQMGGNSFADKIGGRVLPDFLSLSDNPLLASYHGALLLGASRIDDDAVATRETKLVDHGLLKTLLATRVPTKAVPQSTGSRRGWGPAPSNLIVATDKATTEADLRADLLRRVKERGLGYGIVVRHVGGGGSASFIQRAAQMAQQGGQAGTSLAEVYRLYPDGHEEPVKGVEISDMNAAQFRDIVAAGDTPAVYTDEFIPRVGALFSLGTSASTDQPVVSCVAPDLLFEELSLTGSQGPFPNPPIGPSPLAK